MENNTEINEIGNKLLLIGFYLTNANTVMFTDTDLNKRIVNLLSYCALYLNEKLGKTPIIINEKNDIEQVSITPKYLSKKQAVEEYHPLITAYSIDQAIHKKEIKYIKRGNKFFFDKDELNKWVENIQNNIGNKSQKDTIKYV